METGRVHFIAPWYEYYPILADSLRLQTHENWTLHLIHDGPQFAPIRNGEWCRDDRVDISSSPERFNDWGHSLRAAAVVPDAADFVVHTNADNYYVPAFLQEMLAAANGHAGSYCDMIHSHVFPPQTKPYHLRQSRMKCNWIDCGALMVRADLAISTPWISRRFAADWDWIAALLQKTTDFVHVPLPLFVHN